MIYMISMIVAGVFLCEHSWFKQIGGIGLF